MSNCELNEMDLKWCLRRLPSEVREELKSAEGKLILAGGFIRACVAGEEINDIDLLCSSKDKAKSVAERLNSESGKDVWTSDNAITVKKFSIPVQLIHRWTYDRPEDVIPSFDFTIAKAAIWYSSTIGWTSQVAETFYEDLAAKRLVYTSPERNEDAGGSILRVFKFYQRGYRIPLSSLGAVIARLCQAVDFGNCGTEERTAEILTGLLYEVDPNSIDEQLSKEQ